MVIADYVNKKPLTEKVVTKRKNIKGDNNYEPYRIYD